MSESLIEYLVEEEVLETNEGDLSFYLSLRPVVPCKVIFSSKKSLKLLVR